MYAYLYRGRYCLLIIYLSILLFSVHSVSCCMLKQAYTTLFHSSQWVVRTLKQAEHKSYEPQTLHTWTTYTQGTSTIHAISSSKRHYNERESYILVIILLSFVSNSNWNRVYIIFIIIFQIATKIGRLNKEIMHIW